jgi:hypothetical protein
VQRAPSGTLPTPSDGCPANERARERCGGTVGVRPGEPEPSGEELDLRSGADDALVPPQRGRRRRDERGDRYTLGGGDCSDEQELLDEPGRGVRRVFERVHGTDWKAAGLYDLLSNASHPTPTMIYELTVPGREGSRRFDLEDASYPVRLCRMATIALLHTWDLTAEYLGLDADHILDPLRAAILALPDP